MKAAIIQSSYIPWKGYFDLIKSADVFVIYDVVQFTKNDWRNRNKVITNRRPSWLTIPVRHSSLEQRINETTVADPRWANKHWKTIAQSYCSSPGFKLYSDQLESLYKELSNERRLTYINETLLRWVFSVLDINTRIVRAEQFDLPNDRMENLIYICKELGADEYISGPSAQAYFNQELFESSGLRLSWFEYGDYPTYSQKSDVFEHHVSILDLLFMTGTSAKSLFVGSSTKADMG
ncbi:WbqC family protein [Marinihelvus fidelis]|uniref:WbqC family protein n=1 Tax=Marinihelvus fidelis TaxID=2613842 RepID=A0A5N0T4F6_9GAMM|nr:WbqC family protein [Marinihelvus fidelis]KAA9129741.1 WbqC family protein [Marinihelvus fidelis]